MTDRRSVSERERGREIYGETDKTEREGSEKERETKRDGEKSDRKGLNEGKFLFMYNLDLIYSLG